MHFTTFNNNLYFKKKVALQPKKAQNFIISLILTIFAD